jgi:hypothetical protein
MFLLSGQNKFFFPIPIMREIAIMSSFWAKGLSADPREVCSHLLEHGYEEFSIFGQHTIGVDILYLFMKTPSTVCGSHIS